MLITDDVLYGIIRDTWSSTLGFLVDRPRPEPPSAAGVFTVSVKITGAWDGEVRFECPPVLARLIAAAIFQVEAERVQDEQIRDALSELIHIVGGNLKALLPQPVELSFPSLPEHRDNCKIAPCSEMLRLTLSTEGHPFTMGILSNTPRSQVNAESVDQQVSRREESGRP